MASKPPPRSVSFRSYEESGAQSVISRTGSKDGTKGGRESILHYLTETNPLDNVIEDPQGLLDRSSIKKSQDMDESIRAVTSIKTGTFGFMAAPKKKRPQPISETEPTKMLSCGYLYYKLSQWLTVERTIGIIVGITATSLIIYLIIYLTIPTQDIEIYWSSSMSPSSYTCIQKFSATLPQPFHPVFHYILAFDVTSCSTFTSHGADNPQMYALYWLVDDFMHKIENIDLVQTHKDDDKLELLCRQYMQRYILIARIEDCKE